MNAPDIVKLAPTLSPEERYKLIAADMLKRMDHEKPVLSEAETQALVRFDKRSDWLEYVFRVILFKFANSMWLDQLQIAKLRVFAFYVMISHQLERVAMDADDAQIPEKWRAAQYERLRSYIKNMNEVLPDFLAYREAIPRLEQETYGMPVYGEKVRAEILEQFTFVEERIDAFNEMVKQIAADKFLGKYLQPLAKDTHSYLIKKEPPDPVIVEQLVEDIKHLAASERNSRL